VRSLFRDLVVTLKDNLIEDRIFDHVDGQRRTVPIEFHIREEACREQRFERMVDGLLVIRIAGVE